MYSSIYCASLCAAGVGAVLGGEPGGAGAAPPLLSPVSARAAAADIPRAGDHKYYYVCNTPHMLDYISSLKSLIT